MGFKKSAYCSASKHEEKLITKLYQKQLDRYNKGLGPKPNLEELIKKSRIPYKSPQELLDLVTNLKLK